MQHHDPQHLRSRYVVAVAITAAVAVLPTWHAVAQLEDPIVIGQGQQLSRIHFDYTGAALELFAQRIVDRTNSSGTGSVRDRETLIRQTLELSAGGFIGRRELFDFDVLGRLRLSQESLKSDTLSVNVDSDEVLGEFDTLGTFFSGGTLPITVFARRNETLLTRSFGGTLDATLTEYGARIDLRSELAPMQIEYRHRVQSQEDVLRASDFTVQQDTLAYRGQWHPSKNQYLNWTYTLDFVDEKGSLRPTESFMRQDGNITHTMRFGETVQHSIRSDLRLYQSTGNTEITQLRLSERLEMEHGPQLNSRLEYVLDRQERPEFDQTQHRLTTYLEHNLYESLTTIAEAGTEYLTSTDGDFTSTAGFGSLDMRYRKNVPAGRLFAILGLSTDYRDDSDRGGDVPVNDDAVSFDLSGLASIIQRNIDTMSVVVTDPTGLLTFIENVDYRIRQLGDRLEILLIPGGDITAGDTVLVDYIFTPDPANTTLTNTLNASLRYRFTETALRGVSPFVRYMKQSQTRNSDGAILLPVSDIDDIVFGVEYDRPRLSMRVQHEIRDSSLSPFRETLLEGQYTIRAGRGGAFVLGARYDDIDRIDENIRTRVTSLTARWNGRVSDSLTGDMLLLYREEDDSMGFDTTSFEQRLNLTWRRGRTEVFGSIRNAFVDNDVSDTMTQVFLIGVRRSF